MLKGSRYLNYEQRCQIYTLKQRGDSINCIGKAIKVSKSTVYQELKSNSDGRQDIFFATDQVHKKI